VNFTAQLKLRQTRLAALEAGLPALAIRVAPSTDGRVHEDDTGRTLDLAPRRRAPFGTRSTPLFFEDDLASPPVLTVTSYHVYYDGVAVGDFDGSTPPVASVVINRTVPHGRHRIKLVAYNSQSTGASRPIRLRAVVNSRFSAPYALEVYPNQATSDGDEQEFYFNS
jgi:hypothetical protein